MPRRSTNPQGPVRRAQVVSPFGVGAMSVLPGGTSIITAGLDHWYEREDGDGAPVNEGDFKISEWRLQRELGVSHFRLPPDNRKRSLPNGNLYIPALRFPQWHVCRTCDRLLKQPLAARPVPECPDCKRRGRNSLGMVQVPLVAICERGHITDFPWREWVHPPGASCDQPMRLQATGGASLAGTFVSCDCGERRSLGPVIGNTLHIGDPDNGQRVPWLCQGHTPWLGHEEPGGVCGAELRGSQRNSANVYFAEIRTAIYLPQGDEAVPDELVNVLREPVPSAKINLMDDIGQEIPPERLRNNEYTKRLMPYSDDQIQRAVRLILGKEQAIVEAGQPVPGDDRETSFRRAEYQVLRTERKEELLSIKRADLAKYDPAIAQYFDRIMLVDKLRETRAMVGFNRINPESGQTLEEMKRMLWRHVPECDESWLPAYAVYGEGIFLELNQDKLRIWEQEVGTDRIKPLLERFSNARAKRKLRERTVTPRLVMLHTLGHLLINRLTFECGYSSAALRERLYVSNDRDQPMAGVLIYTAAGDSEGTMGGLVRMGKPQHFEALFRRALDEARWCSADPVCMEMGEHGGQGPDGCNLAACHNCALVPETACEEFNRFLDRALVVGELRNPDLGFFQL